MRDRIPAYAFRQLLCKPYLFHVHTDLTDGELSIDDYFRFAQANGIETVIFTEHISKAQSSYRYEDYHNAIVLRSRDFGIRGIAGVEAKVLENGELNVPDEIYDVCPLICFADHGYAGNVDFSEYITRFSKAFADLRIRDTWKVWVHPFRGYDEVPQAVALSMAMVCSSHDVYIEDNDVVPVLELHRLIDGIDSHTREDLMRWKG